MDNRKCKCGCGTKISNGAKTYAKGHHNRINICKKKIENFYSEGKTMDEIANIFKTTKRIIHLRMQEYNIVRRKMIGKNHGSGKVGK